MLSSLFFQVKISNTFLKVLFTTEEIHFYRFPLAALESVFERMKGLFNRWSRTYSPCLVTHLADLWECFNLKIWVERFRYEVFEKGNEDGTVIQKTYQIKVWSVVDADGYASTVFACPQFIDKIKEAKYGFFYSSYQSVPCLLGAYQLSWLMAEKFGKVKY